MNVFFKHLSEDFKHYGKIFLFHINDLENTLFSVNQIIRYTVNLPVYVVEYIVKGEGTVRCYGKEYRINSGYVYILPKDMEHLYYSDKTNPWIKKWFNVTGKLCENYFMFFSIVIFSGVIPQFS